MSQRNAEGSLASLCLSSRWTHLTLPDHLAGGVHRYAAGRASARNSSHNHSHGTMRLQQSSVCRHAMRQQAMSHILAVGDIITQRSRCGPDAVLTFCCGLAGVAQAHLDSTAWARHRLAAQAQQAFTASLPTRSRPEFSCSEGQAPRRHTQIWLSSRICSPGSRAS